MQVAGLSDVASLIPVLQALGKRHANYGVESAHFAVVGEALIWTLADGLGDQFTPEVKEAWLQTWATIVSVMEPALLEAKAANASE